LLIKIKYKTMAENFDKTYPVNSPAISSIKLKKADGTTVINSITKPNTNLTSITEEQDKLMEDKGFAMVGKKGYSFPMIQTDPVEMQKKKIMEQQGVVPTENRAGSAVGNNVLVNNPNNTQPMDKVSANVNGREQMFSNMASNPGEPFTNPATMMPGQQGSFAAYANPARVSENLESIDLGEIPQVKNTEKTTHTMPDGTVMPGKSHSSSMYDGLEFNAGLRKASEEGALDDNPNFKAVVDKAPGMHEKHTQISKANVNAAMKDDAAHASYLKRDINYDNRHGGSNKQMTRDEKHISKLAGDIKYDVKKKRKYDNV